MKQDLEIKHYHHIYNVVLENPLDENDYPMFYEPAHLGIARSFGGTQGLRHHPAVINKIVSHIHA